MSSSRYQNDSRSREGLVGPERILNESQNQSLNQNYSEALQELLMEGSLVDFGGSLSAPPELNQDDGFLSPLRAGDQSRLSPYSHFSESHDNFSDYTTPGFGEDLSDIAFSSMLSLQATSTEGFQPTSRETEALSDDTSRARNSSLGDSVTNPSTRLLSPILTNSPTPSQQTNTFSRSSTSNDISSQQHVQSGDKASPGSGNIRQLTGAAGLGMQIFSDLASTQPTSFEANHTEFRNSSVGDTDPTERHGIKPDARRPLNHTSIPSLGDQTKERQLAKTRAGVEEWLTTANAGEVGSPRPLGTHEGVENQLNNDQSTAMISSQSPMEQSKPLAVNTPSTPGPGLYIRDENEYEESDDAEDEENDNSEISESEEENDDTTPPATVVPNHIQQSPSEVSAGQQHTWSQKPWVDSPFDLDVASVTGQPLSSNAAMARFERRARDIETASQTATIASSLRPRSLESLFSAANISVVPPSEAGTNQISERGREKRPGLFNRILPKRSTSNIRKRKDILEEEQRSPEVLTKRESQGSVTSLKKVPSWARPKSPSIGASNVPTSLSPAARSSTTLAPSTGPWASVTNVIKRARSKSDLSQSSALAEQWASQGGPPVANLRPSEDTVEQPEYLAEPQQRSQLQHHDSDLDVEQDGEHTPTGLVDIPMRALDIPSAPTSEAFRTHAFNANPHIETYMLERVTSEQLKRYRRLVEARLKHANHIKKNNCPSRDFCTTLGGVPKFLEPRKAGPDSEGPAVTFSISRNGSGSEGPVVMDDDSIPATFPEGIPFPPANVHRLPAEFECPLCFQVKKILKPSDWTKHVHEDLQPFTCSFPDCGEPKSFKRKADWVRHENERHRQLEKWVCNYPDCHHTCYRKDNFVQHLVREHKLPEPRLRASKATSRSGQSSNRDQNQVAVLIETCKHDTTSKPDREACRFCGNYLTTWKKLSAHLAKHMEQISLPVLGLVHQADFGRGRVGGPADQDYAHSRNISAGPKLAVGKSTHLDNGYGLVGAQELPSQHFTAFQPESISPEYQNTTYANQHPQLHDELPRPLSASFPGTKNLPRRISPYGEQRLSPNSALLGATSYLESNPLYTTSPATGDNGSNSSAFTQGYTSASTYPPPFMQVPTSQSQENAHLVQSSLYSGETLYTNSPTYDANFSSNDFSSPPRSMPPINQYPQGTIHIPTAQYFDQGSGPDAMIGGQFTQYPQMTSSPYSASSPNAYSQLPLQTHGGNLQSQQSDDVAHNARLRAPQPQAEEYYSNINHSNYSVQQEQQGQPIAPFDQRSHQQPQQAQGRQQQQSEQYGEYF